MRLLIIIILGSVLIGLTYMWTNNNNNAQEKDPDWANSLPHQRKKNATAATPNGSPTQNNALVSVQETARQEIKATTTQEALVQAKINAGIKDPFAPIAPALENTSNPNFSKTAGKSKSPTASPNGNIPPGMVPPPPPNSVSMEDLRGLATAKIPGTLASGLNISELPLPPRDQSIAGKLRLTGILGDRAFFTVVDRLAARANHWPTEFSLKPGHSFHNVYLKAVNEHSATLEEDGEEYLRTLPSIR